MRLGRAARDLPATRRSTMKTQILVAVAMATTTACSMVPGLAGGAATTPGPASRPEAPANAPAPAAELARTNPVFAGALDADTTAALELLAQLEVGEQPSPRG